MEKQGSGFLIYIRRSRARVEMRRKDACLSPGNVKALQLIMDKQSKHVVARTESDYNIHYSGGSLNRYYILCAAHPAASVRDLVVKFGPFIVQISDPLALLERIKLALAKTSF